MNLSAGKESFNFFSGEKKFAKTTCEKLRSSVNLVNFFIKQFISFLLQFVLGYKEKEQPEKIDILNIHELDFLYQKAKWNDKKTRKKDRLKRK